MVFRDSTFCGCRLQAAWGASVHLHGGHMHALPPQTAAREYI